MSQVTREQRLEQVYGAKSNDELRALYDDWAQAYDQDLQALGYSYPPAIAGLVGRCLRERDAPILDARAGTGIVGEVLAILGYTQLTGIDLSDGMLAVTRAKGVYAELKNQILGERLDPRRRIRRRSLGRGADQRPCPAVMLRRADPNHPTGRPPDLHPQRAGLRGRRLPGLARTPRAPPAERLAPTWCALPRAAAEAAVMARAYVFQLP